MPSYPHIERYYEDRQRLIDYKLPEIEKFRQAQRQFKADLPDVLENVRPGRGRRLSGLCTGRMPATLTTAERMAISQNMG